MKIGAIISLEYSVHTFHQKIMSHIKKNIRLSVGIKY